MRVHSIALENFRSFLNLPFLSLDKINVLTGHNNTGKSSIIAALYLLQQDSFNTSAYVRNGQANARIQIKLEDVIGISALGTAGDLGSATATIKLSRRSMLGQQMEVQSEYSGVNHVNRFTGLEPDHFIVPFFSKRKAANFNEDVRLQFANAVTSDLSHLAAKLSRLSNPGFPGHDEYTKWCKKILGFPLYTVPSEGGQKPGIYLPDGSAISIETMGEGVANIASLLASLITSKGKLFLIEEPENDLHPAALRDLLELVVESSRHNQFVVSTHSNIVVQYLAGASDSKLFNVTTEFSQIPAVALVEEVPPHPAARMATLKKLGYSLADFDLWEGWLILEESSAERIIRDFLIPWFFPRLSCLRTISASGIAGVEPVFNDLHRVLKFAHLTPIYQSRTWVLVDGDEPGIKTIDGLRKKFSTWDPCRFKTLSESNFESFYPDIFQDQARQALSFTNKDSKRKAKQDLLIAVIDWLNSDPDRGRRSLAASAREVLQFLELIQAEVIGCE